MGGQPDVLKESEIGRYDPREIPARCTDCPLVNYNVKLLSGIKYLNPRNVMKWEIWEEQKVKVKMKWEGCILDASDFDRVEYLSITRHLMHMRDFVSMQGNYSGLPNARDTILIADDQDERFPVWETERNVICSELESRLAKAFRFRSLPAGISWGL